MGDDNKIHHEYERVVVTADGATAREIRIYGSGNRLMLEAGRSAVALRQLRHRHGDGLLFTAVHG